MLILNNNYILIKYYNNLCIHRYNISKLFTLKNTGSNDTSVVINIQNPGPGF